MQKKTLQIYSQYKMFMFNVNFMLCSAFGQIKKKYRNNHRLFFYYRLIHEYQWLTIWLDYPCAYNNFPWNFQRQSHLFNKTLNQDGWLSHGLKAMEYRSLWTHCGGNLKPSNLMQCVLCVFIFFLFLQFKKNCSDMRISVSHTEFTKFAQKSAIQLHNATEHLDIDLVVHIWHDGFCLLCTKKLFAFWSHTHTLTWIWI